MRLIVCEKNIAAKRIADILSGGKAKKSKTEIPYYSWDDTYVIGLSGHIVDVGFPDGYSSWTKVNEKELLNAEIIYKETKPEIIKQLKDLAKKADEVIIATDYDSEGELIGLEALDIIKEVNPKVKVKRALFSAITEEDIKAAFSNLKTVNKNLAYSSDARRRVDLIWGSILTRFISRASKKMGHNFLSVGRVQTPVLKILVDRERERKKFVPETYWVVKAILLHGRKELEAVYEKDKIFDKALKDKLENLEVEKAKILSIEKKEVVKQPPTPFNTTDFLREAARLGLTAPQAMNVISSLYLKGFVSYPRTDNTVYPKTLDLKKILSRISKHHRLGSLAKELLKKKVLTPTKGKKSTKDHPPIHPVGVPKKGELNAIEDKIYELVYRRFLATLSDPSKELRVKIVLDVGGEKFVLNGLRIIEEGWRKYYPYSKVEEKEIPDLKKGDTLKVKEIVVEEKQTNPPGRYGYSKIIKIMDELNLGTKATRPGILQKLVQRGYVSKGSQLIPSKIAMKVVESLEKYAPLITKPDMTAKLEEEMEKIAEGKVERDKVVDESKGILEKVLVKMQKKTKEIGDEVRKAYYWEPLGTCDKCGKGEMRIIKSKSSKKRFVACSNYPNCKNSWPCPQKGRLFVLEEKCKYCGFRKVLISTPGRRAWKLCLNVNCPGKKDKKKE